VSAGITEVLLEQEQRLQFASFSHETALDLGAAMVSQARERNLTVVVDIRFGEQQLFHASLPGTSADNDEWVERKARVVRRFGHSTRYLEAFCNSIGVPFAEEYLLDPTTHSPSGGSFPLLVRQAGMVGTISVSGLPTGDEDHDFVVDLLTAFLAQ
jgi:uncharacterized protein (UPF0303 family)